MRPGLRMRAAIAVLVSLAIDAGVEQAAHAQSATEAAPARADGRAEAGVEGAPPEDPRVAEARALFDTGRALAAEQRWEEALERFRRSLELVDRPSTRWNVAASLYALDRPSEAIPELERYLAAAASRGDDPAAIAEAERMLADARGAVARVTLHLLPADARVRVDGRPVEGGAERALELDPGPHVVRAEAEEHEPVLEELDLRRGEARVHAIALVPSGARLDVRTGSAEARIRVDGREVARGEGGVVLPPGAHVLRIDAPGRAPIERALTLAPGERLRFDLELPPAEGGIEAWVVVLTGAAALAAGAAAVAIGVALAGAPPAAASGGSSGVVLAF